MSILSGVKNFCENYTIVGRMLQGEDVITAGKTIFEKNIEDTKSMFENMGNPFIVPDLAEKMEQVAGFFGSLDGSISTGNLPYPELPDEPAGGNI
ncbi:MAG: hypothetical protein IJ877_03940 [Candidatus Gastranaerophilales bacterium]|nr:hypothetical protein [Candidatus Gastranaerophilales bacterium]